MPQKTNFSKINEGRELELDVEKNGPITEQIKNVEKVIASPIAKIDYLRIPSDLRPFAYKVKKLVKAAFRGYSSVELERLFILHFIYAFKNAKFYKKKTIREAEKFAKKILVEVIIRRHIREKNGILKLVKGQSPSDK